MNKRELNKTINHHQRQYHIPGMSNIHPRKRNALFLSPANTIEHEVGKCIVAYELLKMKHKFISEAVCNKTKERNDVVDLVTNMKYEVETSAVRAKRFEGRRDVIVIKLFELPVFKFPKLELERLI